MNIPGENSINILSSNEYLTRVNLMDAASEDLILRYLSVKT